MQISERSRPTDVSSRRAPAHRDRTVKRVARAARVALSAGRGVSPELIADVCAQIGLHPHAFRTLLPTDDDLLDEVNEILVSECADRLKAGIARFRPVGSGDAVFVQAAEALAASWPLDCAGLTIRAERRFRALRDGRHGNAAVAGDRRFAAELAGVFEDLMVVLGRKFAWPPPLAVRVIIDTYERSFEAWVLDGNPESQFEESPFVQRTLPTLLREMSVPT